MGKKNKLHLRRDQALQKQQAIQQRQVLLNQIAQININQEAQGNMIQHQESKTIQQNREMALLKQKMNIQLNQQEQKLIEVKKQQQIDENFEQDNINLSNNLKYIVQEQDNTQIIQKELGPEQERPKNIHDVIYTYDYETDADNDDQLYLIENFLEVQNTQSDDYQKIRFRKDVENSFIKKSSQLPIDEVRLDIIHELKMSDVFCINAATGSGKSTQVPQFLLCDGIGIDQPFYEQKIIMSEPRRVAVIGLSERIRNELGVSKSELIETIIGHAVRGHSINQETCKLNIVTEGVLLQILLQDALLRDHSVVILDEAHERSQDFDLILGCLARAVKIRRKMFIEQLKDVLLKEQYENLIEYYKNYIQILNDKKVHKDAIKRVSITKEQYEQLKVFPLKLIIMSATIGRELNETEGRLFSKTPKTIVQTSKTFPIAIHYELQPQNNYIQTTFQKIQQIYQSCMGGNILVFLAGKSDISQLYKLLEMYFSQEQIRSNEQQQNDNKQKDSQNDEIINSFDLSELSESDEEQVLKNNDEQQENKNNSQQQEQEYTYEQLHTISANGSGTIISPEDIELLRQEYIEMFGDMNNMDSIIKSGKQDQTGRKKRVPIVLPLHSQLPLKEQQLIYQKIDPSTQMLIILATNIAESSVTVPDVRFVIDACRQKQKVSSASGSRLAVQWCTEANLAQRSGRTGRTCPGHCFRLITPGQVSQFQQFPTPDILSLPIENAIVKIVRLGFYNIYKFPFLTDPGEKRIKQSLELLHGLNILVKVPQNNNVKLTQFGAIVSYIPLDFRPAHIIAQALMIIKSEKQQQQINKVEDDGDKIIKMLQNLSTNDKTFFTNVLFFAISISNSDIFEQNTFSFPVKTHFGDIIDQFFTFGAFMAYNGQVAKQINFCKQKSLRYQIFQEAAKVFKLLCQKWKFNINPTFFQTKPTKDTILTLLQMYLRSNLTNIAFLEYETSNLQSNNYLIPPVNIYDYLAQDELEQKLTKKQLNNQLISKAKINKFSYYFGKTLPSIVCFREYDVILQEIKSSLSSKDEERETYQVRIYLKGVSQIQLDYLEELVEFSPFLVLSDPICFYYKEGDIYCKCKARYDNFYIQKDIGEVQCEFPGKTYFSQILYNRYDLLNQTLIKLNIIILLQKYKYKFGTYYITGVSQILKLVNEKEELQFSNKYIDKLNLKELVDFVMKQDLIFSARRITTSDIQLLFKFQAFRVKSMLSSMFTDKQQFEQFWQHVIEWCK